MRVFWTKNEDWPIYRLEEKKEGQWNDGEVEIDEELFHYFKKLDAEWDKMQKTLHDLLNKDQ